MRLDSIAIREVCLRVLLVAGGALVGLVAAEIAIRVGTSRYEYAAASIRESSAMRIWSRVPGSREMRPHPDNGERHLVIHNNLGLRQHRDIEPVRRPGELRIGLFGDSFIENVRVAAPYSLSEVLDHLLNQFVGPTTVLNFGVDGYGPDQAYLFYRESEAAKQLDIVVYLFSSNDIRNLHENNLFQLNEDQVAVPSRRSESPLWIRAVSRLHLTYLGIDIRNRLRAMLAGAPSEVQAQLSLATRRLSRELRSEHRARFHDEAGLAVQAELEKGLTSESLAEYLAIFNSILDQWNRQVTQAGGRFIVAPVPTTPLGVGDRLFADYSWIDLPRRFADVAPPRESWTFRNDGHWNELGNGLAAVELFKQLSDVTGAGTIDGDALERELCVYYRAFSDSVVTEFCRNTVSASDARAEQIRRRYTSLE